jgi:hypothetical protein
VSGLPKAMISIASVEFSCEVECAQYTDITLPSGQSASLTSEQYIWQYLDFTSYAYWPWIGWQLLELLVFRIFIVWAIVNVNYVNR